MTVSATQRGTRTTLRALALAAILAVFATPIGAEIFKWKDERGRLNFAQDLNQVPIRFREQATGGALKEGKASPIQRYQAAPAAPASRSRGASSASRVSKDSAGKVYKVRVERAGTTMRVNVKLNDNVTAPFYVDTGASDVVLPEWVAKELGLDLAGARTAYYGTANGTIQQSLVTLDSVELGGARAEKVPASVSTTMSTGLLGLSFFNHFRYRVDPAAGVITLQSNGLVESGMIRGGRSATQWKSQFVGLVARRVAIEQEIESINPNRPRRKKELNGMIDEVDRQYAVLEDEADEAHVPMQWRD